MTQEKSPRISPRFACSMAVTVEPSRDAAGHVWTPLTGLARNVGLQGALILFPERIPPGSHVILTFYLAPGDPLVETPSVEHVEATVVWVLETLEGPLRFQHGLRFLEPQINPILQAWPGHKLPD